MIRRPASSLSDRTVQNDTSRTRDAHRIGWAGLTWSDEAVIVRNVS